MNHIKKKEKAISNFIDDNIENEKSIKREKLIKSDFAIIERLDKVIIDESGRQLLREQY